MLYKIFVFLIELLKIDCLSKLKAVVTCESAKIKIYRHCHHDFIINCFINPWQMMTNWLVFRIKTNTHDTYLLNWYKSQAIVVKCITWKLSTMKSIILFSLLGLVFTKVIDQPKGEYFFHVLNLSNNNHPYIIMRVQDKNLLER